MPPAGLSYPILLGIWWRRKWIQHQVIAAWLTPVAKGLSKGGGG